MSTSDRKVEEVLAKSGEEHQPPYAWQEQVWRQIEEPYRAPAEPSRPRFFSWPLVSLAVLVLFVGGAVMIQQQRTAKSRAKREVAMDLKLKRQIEEFQQRVALAQLEVRVAQEEIDIAFTMLEAAVDERSREEAKAAGMRARQMLKNKQARLEAIRVAGIMKAKSKGKANARKEKKLIDKCAKSNDPLCGL